MFSIDPRAEKRYFNRFESCSAVVAAYYEGMDHGSDNKPMIRNYPPGLRREAYARGHADGVDYREYQYMAHLGRNY